MTFTLAEQMLCLWWSFVCGLILGVFYAVLKFVRVYVFCSKSSVFVCDLLFMIVSAFVSVGFSIGFSRGNTRYFVIISELTAFLAVHFTLGKVIVGLLGFIYIKVMNFLKKSLCKIRKYPKRVLQDTPNI